MEWIGEIIEDMIADNFFQNFIFYYGVRAIKSSQITTNH
jgi:hypothetical protein